GHLGRNEPVLGHDRCHGPSGPEAVLGDEERSVAHGAPSRSRRRRQPGERRKRPLTAARGRPPEAARRCTRRQRAGGGKPMSESTRIYVTGSCDGLDRLREGLAAHPELDFVGWSENVAEASAALAGG